MEQVFALGLICKAISKAINPFVNSQRPTIVTTRSDDSITVYQYIYIHYTIQDLPIYLTVQYYEGL